jgi:hypothetical protein
MVGRWLSFGLFGAVAIACGGGVSLGNAGSGLGGADGADSGSGGSGTAKLDCTAPNACGPALGLPAKTCPDGSIAGNTGKCIEKNGACAWEVLECPPDPPKPACFDASGNLDASFKKCNVTADCKVITFQQNCCGTMVATGVNTANAPAAQKCGDDRAATFPGCGCAQSATQADDGSTDPAITGTTANLTCDGGLCKSTFKGEVCGKYICTATQQCCSGIPLPEPKCYEGGMCPISQRVHKKDITYLSQDDRQRLNDQLMSFPLATYRYKTESDSERPHLGFIIDDVAPSPAVLANGERVDMYGYTTMTVAALQTQARELAALRRQVEDLKAECGKKTSKR